LSDGQGLSDLSHGLVEGNVEDGGGVEGGEELGDELGFFRSGEEGRNGRGE